MICPSASKGLKGAYYGYETGEFVCSSLPSVADSGGIQGWGWQVWALPGRVRQLAEVNIGDMCFILCGMNMSTVLLRQGSHLKPVLSSSPKE